MARKRHGGLGRGLDALIPQSLPRQPDQQKAKQSTSETESSETKLSGTNPSEADQPGANSAGADFSGAERAEKTGSGAGPAEAGIEASTVTGSSDSSGSGSAGPAVTGSAGPDSAGSSPVTPAGSTSQASPESMSKSDSMSGTENTDSSQAGIRMLRLSQVDPNRSQPRQNFEDEALEELAESIRQFGVLQPILVQKKGSRYEIIAGERRWRASRKAGLKEIPAIIREYSDQETLELSLIENIQREDLNPIEEAKAFRRLLDEFGLRQEDLAARVSKSRTAITNAVRLLKLDERVQEMLIEDRISMGHARALLPVEIPEEQFLLAQEVADRHLSVREVEKLIKTRMSGKKKKTGKGKDGIKERDPALELAYRSIEERLKQSLGTKAAIRSGGDGTGRIEIDFYSHEDLEKIVDLLT